jgi:hypothetical protein
MTGGARQSSQAKDQAMGPSLHVAGSGYLHHAKAERQQQHTRENERAQATSQHQGRTFEAPFWVAANKPAIRIRQAGRLGDAAAACGSRSS